MPSGVYDRITAWGWQRRKCDCGTCALCRHRVRNRQYYARVKKERARVKALLAQPLPKKESRVKNSTSKS